MKTLLVTGVCGVGKSTITSELAEKLGCSWGDYVDVMFEVMGETDKDKIQYLDWDDKESVINQADKLIVNKFNNHDEEESLFLFENHLSIVQDNKFITFPVEDYERYNPVGIVVIEALSKDVKQRRHNDPLRNRLTED